MANSGVVTYRLRSAILLAFLVLAFQLVLVPSTMALDAIPIQLQIEKTHNTMLGEVETVSISRLAGDFAAEQPLGGFDLLIAYDADVLTAVSADGGQLFDHCNWEYFSYSTGPFSGCDEDCPSGLIRLVAVANIANDPTVPNCYLDTLGELASIDFLVTDDNSWECQFIPVSFYWLDCADNSVANVTGDTLFVSSEVYDYDWTPPLPVPDTLPSYGGIPDSCFGSIDTSTVLRQIIFYNGGVDIHCADSIDERGDINLNGIAYEIADWVLYTNYFVYGPEVFTANMNAQVAASDCNYDHIWLSWQDLVVLYRVIIGDGLPNLDSPWIGDTAYATFTQDMSSKTVALQYSDSLAGGWLYFVGEIEVTSMVPGIGMYSIYDGEYTRVLIDYVDPNDLFQATPIFSGDLFTYTGQGILLEAQTADFDDTHVIATVEVLGAYGSHFEADPDSMFAFWQWAVDDRPVLLYLGDFQTYTASDLDPATILIDGQFPVYDPVILPEVDAFEGEVLQVTMSGKDYVIAYSPMWGISQQFLDVAGEFTDQTAFANLIEVTLVGHLPGDLNYDYALDISDILFLVEQLFQGGPQPAIPQSSDVNQSGSVDIIDLTTLVELIFM